MSQVLTFLSARAKAIAAFLAVIVVAVAARYGFHVDINVAETVIAAAITGLAAHQVPNTPKEG